LPPEEGALVASVLESIALERAQQPAQAAGETLAEGQEAPQVPDPAEDPWAARRADALVAVCEHATGVAPADLEGAPGRTRMVVHVDASLLSGKQEGGRCTLEDGQALPPSVAERLACEAEVMELWEREGLPIDLGRSRRTGSPRLRTALNARDRPAVFLVARSLCGGRMLTTCSPGDKVAALIGATWSRSAAFITGGCTRVPTRSGTSAMEASALRREAAG